MRIGDHVIATTSRYCDGSDHKRVDGMTGIVVYECSPVFKDYIDVRFPKIGRSDKAIILMLNIHNDLKVANKRPSRQTCE